MIASLSGTQTAHVLERYNQSWSTRDIAEDLKLPVGTVSAVIHQHVQAARPARLSLKANGFATLPAPLVTTGNLDSQLPEMTSDSNTPPATTMALRNPLLGGLSNEVRDQIFHHSVRSRTPRQIMKLVNLGPGTVFEVINHARHAAGKSPIRYDVETADQIADLFNAGWNPKDITQVLELTEGGVAEIIDGLPKQYCASTPGSTSLQTLPSVPRPVEVQPHWERAFTPQPISSISMFQLGAKNKSGHRLVEVDIRDERRITMDQRWNKHSGSRRSDSICKHGTAKPLVPDVPRIPTAARHVPRGLPNVPAASGITENRNIWQQMLDEALNAHERLSPFELDSLRRVFECNVASRRGRSHSGKSAQGTDDHDPALHTQQMDPPGPGALQRFAASSSVSHAHLHYAPQPNFAPPQVAANRNHVAGADDDRNFPLAQYRSTELYSQSSGQGQRCQSIYPLGRTAGDSEYPPQSIEEHNNPHHGHWSKEKNTQYGNPTLMSNSQQPHTHRFDAIYGAPGNPTDVPPPEYQSPHAHSRIAPVGDDVGSVEGPIADRFLETDPVYAARMKRSQVIGTSTRIPGSHHQASYPYHRRDTAQIHFRDMRTNRFEKYPPPPNFQQLQPGEPRLDFNPGSCQSVPYEPSGGNITNFADYRVPEITRTGQTAPPGGWEPWQATVLQLDGVMNKWIESNRDLARQITKSEGIQLDLTGVVDVCSLDHGSPHAILLNRLRTDYLRAGGGHLTESQRTILHVTERQCEEIEACHRALIGTIAKGPERLSQVQAMCIELEGLLHKCKTFNGDLVRQITGTPAGQVDLSDAVKMRPLLSGTAHVVLIERLEFELRRIMGAKALLGRMEAFKAVAAKFQLEEARQCALEEVLTREAVTLDPTCKSAEETGRQMDDIQQVTSHQMEDIQEERVGVVDERCADIPE